MLYAPTWLRRQRGPQNVKTSSFRQFYRRIFWAQLSERELVAHDRAWLQPVGEGRLGSILNIGTQIASSDYILESTHLGYIEAPNYISFWEVKECSNMIHLSTSFRCESNNVEHYSLTAGSGEGHITRITIVSLLIFLVSPNSAARHYGRGRPCNKVLGPCVDEETLIEKS